MDVYLAEGSRKIIADEIFTIVRDAYNKANHDYLQKQLDICSEYLTEEQKETIFFHKCYEIP
jgi:hypothetical protein